MSDKRPTIELPHGGAETVAKWLTGGLAGVELIRTYMSGLSGPVDVLVTHVPGGWQPVAILVSNAVKERLTIPEAAELPPCPEHTHD
jgi:hypothetical protein